MPTNIRRLTPGNRGRRVALAMLLMLSLLPLGAHAGAPAGGEFQVNTTTASSQGSPSVAMDSAGNFVVVWESFGQDGDRYGVYGQRYTAAGVAQGSEFLVNTYTTGYQQYPSVAMDGSGNFVVTWQSYDQDGSGYGVYGQRYTAAGVAQGGEFQVNTTMASEQERPSVAMDSAGNFVVAWESFGQDGDYEGVYAQRYSAAGVAQGSEFQVNTTTARSQHFPSVAMDSSGNFAVVWTSSGQDGQGYGVYGQRYNVAGVAQGSEFRVNTTTDGDQYVPGVAMGSSGNFVVVWESYPYDGSGYDMYGQRYNMAGVAQGSELRVNTTTVSHQQHPSVTMNGSGTFVVTWMSYLQDGSGSGIYAQRYSAAGVARGDEFLVNTTTANNQQYPSVAMDSSGNFVVTWQSYDQDGSDWGVYGQRYANSTPTVTLGSVPARDEGTELTAGLSLSDDGPGPWTLTIDYGDGSALETHMLTTLDAVSLRHTYMDSGTFTLAVTLRDAAGGTGTTSGGVVVRNLAPTATFTNTGPVAAGSPVTLRFADAHDPSSADLAAGFHYAVACDNAALDSATYAGSGASPTTTCTFAGGAGSHAVRGRIIDKDGGFTEYSTTVTVNATAPTVTPEPSVTATPSPTGVQVYLPLLTRFRPPNAPPPPASTRPE